MAASPAVKASKAPEIANTTLVAVEVARAGAGLDRAGADEQQRLVGGVVGEVVERSDQGNAGNDIVAGGEKRHRRAEPGRDDAHVLDRAVRQEAPACVVA